MGRLDGTAQLVACGCVKVGEIPGYALFPDGVPVATSIFYKELGTT
jgi:hypothetical protein